MRKHLSSEEVVKFLDTSEPDQNELEWYCEASEHIAQCPNCKNLVRDAFRIERMAEEGDVMLQDGLRMLAIENKWKQKKAEQKDNITPFARPSAGPVIRAAANIPTRFPEGEVQRPVQPKGEEPGPVSKEEMTKQNKKAHWWDGFFKR